MPAIYLDRTERNQSVAQAIARLQPWLQVREGPERIGIFGADVIRLQRQALEGALGASLSDEEWRGLFARVDGDVLKHDDREYAVEDYVPGGG